MKKLILVVCLNLCSSVFMAAQQGTVGAAPDAVPKTMTSVTAERGRSLTVYDPGSVYPTAITRTQSSSGYVFESNATDRLYRKTTEAEMASVKPEQADTDKFAEFLKQPQTGLIKLIKNIDCGDDKFVNVSDDCRRYTMPGGGASYSFRLRDYRFAKFADLTYGDDGFKSAGRNVQGIFIAVGNIPLENVTLQTPGLDFLVNFKPETESKKVGEKYEQFAEGVRSNGFIYRSHWNLLENTTYVLRSIAYTHKTYAGFGYSVPDDFDKKRDVIVAFRVVRKSDDGSVTILWKKLADKKSPKLK